MDYLPPSQTPLSRLLDNRTRSRTVAPVRDWPVQQERTEGQFLEYWKVIRSNIGWIALLAMIGAALGWMVAQVQSPMYQAHTVMDIRSLNENFLNPREGSSTGTTESVLPESYVQTEIKILQSDSIRKRALDRIPVPAQPVDTRSNSSFWQDPLGVLRPTPKAYASLIADAGRRVKVRAIGNTRIVEVLCDAQDGQLAASVCNTLARTYMDNNLESRYASTKETSDWLESQLNDVRNRLTKAENDLKDAGKNTDFGLTDVGQNPAQDKLRQLQAELSRSQTERIIKESNYRVAASHDPESLPVEMDNGPIREYRLKLADLRRQLTEMSATMTPEHYRVRELAAQIEGIQKALQKERDGLVNRLKADLEASLQRESMISAAFDKQAALVSEGDDKAVRYNMVKRDVDSERRLYETLLQKVGEVGLTAALRTSTISIVDPAVAPLRPYSPNAMESISIGLLAGCALGLAFSLMRSRDDRTLCSPGESAFHLQLRELGVIPSARTTGLRTLFQKRIPPPPPPPALDPDGAEIEMLPAPSRLGGLLGPRQSDHSVALATWHKSPEMSEAFYGTMNSLLLSGRHTSGGRVLVVTSPDVGDGKTTVAANLAIALGQIGRRVVLVDGDLRKPRLHTIFNRPDTEGGLARLLEDDVPLKQRPLHQFVYRTDVPNLYVLPTKPASEGVLAKLHSSRMRGVLDRLRQDFEEVIIDSPPMLHISDARVLGWLADGVVLVFRARKTTKEAAFAVHDCLAQDGIRVIGTVLNDWNPRKGERYGAYASYLRAAS